MNISNINFRAFRRFLALGLLLCMIAPVRCAGAQDILQDYKAPTIVIPYAWKKPTLDGSIHEDEWQGAVSLNALQTTAKSVSAANALLADVGRGQSVSGDALAPATG